MADKTLNIAPNADYTSVTLRFSVGDHAGSTTASPEQLDAIIQGLAAVRAKLSPAVPASHLGAPIRPTVDFQAVIPAEHIDGQRVLLFRHPGLGWLSFELTTQAALALATSLLPIVQADRSERAS